MDTTILVDTLLSFFEVFSLESKVLIDNCQSGGTLVQKQIRLGDHDTVPVLRTGSENELGSHSSKMGIVVQVLYYV